MSFVEFVCLKHQNGCFSGIGCVSQPFFCIDRVNPLWDSPVG